MEKNSLLRSYALFWKNIRNFRGRTRRSDFWNATIINVMLSIVLNILFGFTKVNYLAALAFLTMLFIPMLAIGIRRLHDIGKSGAYYLVSLIPIIGQVLLLFWFTRDSQPGANAWGDNPKNMNTLNDNAFNENNNKKVCGVCGAELNDGDLFCAKCGCEVVVDYE